MDHNPAHRPSAADLLEFELFVEPKVINCVDMCV